MTGSYLFFPVHPILDEHGEPDLDEIDEEEEEEEDALDDMEMEVEQAPPTIPVPAPVEPPVKRKRGRPPKNPPKASPAKNTTVAPTGNYRSSVHSLFFLLNQILTRDVSCSLNCKRMYYHVRNRC